MVPGTVDPHVRASLLWGVVGGLAFLVLVQAYHLLGGEFVGIATMGGVAVAVAGVTAVAAHLVRRRLASRGRAVSESESS